MNKIKIKKKDFKYNDVVKVGYCQLQSLLCYQEANWYNSGVNGWNCDIYYFDDVFICTGYRPFGNIEPDYKIIKKYETKAKKIVYSWSKEDGLTFDQCKKKVTKLLKDFIKKVKKTTEAQR